MKPRVNSYHVTREELDAMVIPDGSHEVMIRIPYRNIDEKTDAGVYLVGDEDFKPAVHAERWGYVYKVPSSVGSVAERSSSWDTTMEVEVGDKVWFDFREALYAYTFECDGDWYKLFEYDFLHVAVRDGKTIPLNGYVIFNPFTPPKKSELLIESKVDNSYGIVDCVGRKNTAYDLPMFSDDIDIEAGDHVLFEQGTSCFPLESGMHNEFSKDEKLLQQRKKIVAVVDKEHENILRLHHKVVGVELKMWKDYVGDIKLLMSQRSYRIAVVKDTSKHSLPLNTVVLIPKQKGTIFGDLEYYTEDRLLYYETSS